MPLVVFDLDGTLIDSRRDLADAANALIVERGGAPLPVDDIAGMVGEGAALLVRRALAAAGLTPDSEGALPRFLDLYSDRLLVHTRAYEGVAQMLEALAQDYPLAVLTNKPLAATRAILAGLDLDSHFQWILGGDGPLPRKPDPAALRFLIEDAGAVKDATVMVGDSPIDLATARAAGTRVVLAAYGFGFRPDQSNGGLVARATSEVAVLVRQSLA